MIRKSLTPALAILCLLLMASVCTVFAQDVDSPPEWTRALCMEFQTIRDVVISPDGEWIAYVVREALMEGEKSEYLSHIWMVSADGKVNVQYTRGEKSCTSPAFSPDGQYLAFTTSRGKKSQVWVMRMTGGEAEQVTEAKAGVSSFRWSPDSRTIAFTMRNSETEEEEKEKKEKRDVILVDQNFKYAHIYTIPLKKDKDGKRPVQRLTGGDFHVTGLEWSPDGQSIVFSHQPDPRLNTGFSTSDISIVPADSGEVTPVVTWPGVDGNPIWSPNSQWIAFSAQGGRPEPIGLGDVYIVSAKGGAPRPLEKTPDRSARILGWSKDSKQVYVSESIGTTQQVMAVPLSGKAPRFITSGEGVFSNVDFDAATKTMAFTFENVDTPADVFISPVGKMKMQKLTALNDNIKQPLMGKTKVLVWASKDGMEIEGLLTYPVNYTEGMKVPLILQVHGGPAGVFSQRFTGGSGIYMTQVFAQNGYAILRPNPRGSQGYGKDFRYANFKDWGFGDFDDIMYGVDHVIEMGVAHSDSLCLMGWSYGGYMTSFAVTRTNRFKAASMGAGLPNLVSMTTTTDIPDYLAAHMGGEFWNDYETYEKHSAMYRIKNVTTPTQVIHGQQDFRVPFTQGQEFYVALQRRGVPTEMVVYPRTPHGPREPKFLMDVTQRILTWFGKHLRGE